MLPDDGVQYGFTLRFYNNQYDPSGLYWKVDMNTLVVKSPSITYFGGFENEG